MIIRRSLTSTLPGNTIIAARRKVAIKYKGMNCEGKFAQTVDKIDVPDSESDKKR